MAGEASVDAGQELCCCSESSELREDKVWAYAERTLPKCGDSPHKSCIFNKLFLSPASSTSLSCPLHLQHSWKTVHKQ